MAKITVQVSTRAVVSMRDMKQGQYGRIVSNTGYEDVVVLAAYGGKVVSLPDGTVWSLDLSDPELMVELYPPRTKIEITI